MGRLFFNTLGLGVLRPPDDEDDPDPKRKNYSLNDSTIPSNFPCTGWRAHFLTGDAHAYQKVGGPPTPAFASE
jgi:hypothetical protein